MSTITSTVAGGTATECSSGVAALDPSTE